MKPQIYFGVHTIHILSTWTTAGTICDLHFVYRYVTTKFCFRIRYLKSKSNKLQSGYVVLTPTLKQMCQ